MIQVRFQANYDDPRPVNFPPPGPFWVTGYKGDESCSFVVAFVDKVCQITEFWPEAAEIDVADGDRVPVFSDRFPKPDWWAGKEEF